MIAWPKTSLAGSFSIGQAFQPDWWRRLSECQARKPDLPRKLQTQRKRHMPSDPIFEPLKFTSSLGVVKNRIFRSSISGRFDNYDGSGTHARINWEEKFARGGVGAIISSYVPGPRAGPDSAEFRHDRHDDKIHLLAGRRQSASIGTRTTTAYLASTSCSSSHSGRQQDMGGVENLFKKAHEFDEPARLFPRHPLPGDDEEEIRDTRGMLRPGSPASAGQAGLDGVETHSANGYLINQFLSSGINDRRMNTAAPWKTGHVFSWRSSRPSRAKAAGYEGFHLQCKINGRDHNNALFPGTGRQHARRRESSSARCWSRRAYTQSMFPAAAFFPIRATRPASSR